MSERMSRSVFLQIFEARVHVQPEGLPVGYLAEGIQSR